MGKVSLALRRLDRSRIRPSRVALLLLLSVLWLWLRGAHQLVFSVRKNAAIPEFADKARPEVLAQLCLVLVGLLFRFKLFLRCLRRVCGWLH